MSSPFKFKLQRQADKIGVEWNQEQRLFILADGEGPPVSLTPVELVDLGVELVVMGTEALVQRRWH